MRNVEIGDKIHARGITVTITKILFQEHFSDDWDIEFLDDFGQYRHWRNWLDGGYLIPHD